MATPDRPREKKAWTIDDLKNLVDDRVVEDLRLEFKRSEVLNNAGRDREKRKQAITKLSTAVAALLNTEGGTLIIGIVEDESSGKPPYCASRLDDGVDGNYWQREGLQDALTQAISPEPPPFWIAAISNPDKSNHYYYVLTIPPGTTAYQTRDFYYWGRRDTGREKLLDHEIRNRMLRNRVPSGSVRLGFFRSHPSPPYENHDFSEFGEKTSRCIPSPTVLAEVTRIEQAIWKGQNIDRNIPVGMYESMIYVRNTSDLTIKEFGLWLALLDTEEPDHHIRWTRDPVAFQGVKLLPGELHQAIGNVFVALDPQEPNYGSLWVHWRLLIDDAPWQQGAISLLQLIQTARVR